jgi:3-hydroxyacyl-CoA dehydrogenase
MKNKILMGLLIVSVFALGVLSVRAWDHYKVSARVQAEVQNIQREREVQEQQKAEAIRAQAEAEEKSRIEKACKSITETYNKLTPYQKTITEKPECNLEQVE